MKSKKPGPEGRPSKFRTIRIVRKPLLLLSSLVLALTLSEVAVRLVRPQQLVELPDLWMPAEGVGYEKRPGLDTPVNIGDGQVRVTTDEDGFRVGRHGRVDAERQLLILGDSFMEALQVEYEASVAGLLETRLAEHLEGPVAVRNTGVSGWTPDQYLTRARKSFTAEPPDAVLVALYLGNDLVPRSTSSQQAWDFSILPPVRFPRSRTWQSFKDDLFFPLQLRVTGRSHLAALVWNASELFRMRIGLWEGFVPFGLRLDQRDSPRWDVTVAICEAIAREAESVGATPLFVLLPAYVQVEPDRFPAIARALGDDMSEYDLSQPGAVMADKLTARGLAVLDALPSLRAAQARGTSTFGEVDRHLSARGHEVVADLVEEAIVDAMRARRAEGAR